MTALPLRTSALFTSMMVVGCQAAAPTAESAPQPPAPSPPSAVTAPYSAAQAERGLTVFQDACAGCHYPSDFSGAQFESEWNDRSVRDFYRSIVATMPEDDPGGLEAQQYIDVVAFFLSLNGFPAGEVELKADEEALRAFNMTAAGD